MTFCGRFPFRNSYKWFGETVLDYAMNKPGAGSLRQYDLPNLPVVISRQSRVALPQQVGDELKRLILEGYFRPGSVLPSSRALCDALKVGRSTIIEAFEQLKSEGYLVASAGSATRVSDNIPSALPEAPLPETHELRLNSLSDYANRVHKEALLYERAVEPEIPFYCWRIARDATPLREFKQLISRFSLSSEQEMLLDYQEDPLGHRPLRDAISKYLEKSKGIKADPQQILIVTGLPQAMNLISRIHLERGDLAVVEEPCYPPVRKVFEAEGASTVSLKVDEDGLTVDNLLRAPSLRVRLVYLTPTHQFPVGSRLSLARRLNLLTWAGTSGAFIVEDEHDSEFTYGSNPMPALKALDKLDSVIYIGNFAKVMFPSLSVAYMVLPRDLTSVYAKVRQFGSDAAPLPIQCALADFIQRGLLRKHIRRMQGIYEARRDVLMASLSWYFGDKVEIRGEHAGLHIYARFKTTLSDAEIVERALKAGVGITPIAPYYAGLAPQSEFVLGFADLETAEIREGIRRLAEIIL